MLRLFAALLALAVASPAFADIHIAVVAPLSGPYKVLGEQIRDGVQKAVNDANAKGGVNGQTLVLDVEDDVCKAENAVAAANRAAGRGDVLVVGHVCAAAAEAAAEVYAASGIVLISPAVSADSFTERRAEPSIFRLAAVDSSQGQVAGAYIARAFPKQRIALLDDGSPYARPIAEAVHAALAGAGIREARREPFDGGAKDYKDLANRLIDDAIDTVFIAGYQGDIALILKALRAAKSPMQVMGPDSIATGQFLDLAGDDANGTLFTFFADRRADPAAANAVRTLRAAGIEPVGFVLPAYAAVQLWAAASAEAQSTDAKAVSERLQQGNYSTVIGWVAFNSQGDAAIPGFSVYRWEGGEVVPVE